MRKLFIFDIDGTLTPSRRMMNEKFQNFFDKWSDENPFYLVSGSDLEKIKEQVPHDILIKAKGIFSCSGNKFYNIIHKIFESEFMRRGMKVIESEVFDFNLEYENVFNPPDDLLKYLEDTLGGSDYPVKAGQHIEDRGAMVNFSIVGRNCTLQERKDYFQYDNLTDERKEIAKYIKDNWNYLDAHIGGQISIDICEKGFDKSQVILHIKNPNNENFVEYDKYIFIGDRTMEGGNDYPLAKVMNEMNDCEVFQSGEPSAEDGYKRTQEILEELND